MKKCFKCLCDKPLESFHKHSKMKDGRLNKCAACVVKDVDTWRKSNPEARKAEHARKRERDGFRTRDEYLTEKKKNAIGKKASASKYVHKRRQKIENKAMTEFDEFVLEEAFKLAEKREKLTGFKWHVDHIVPLHHKEACGLHTASNFQVVPASWNVKKGNRNMNTFFDIAGY